MSQFSLFLQFESDPRVELVAFSENANVADVRAKAVGLGFEALAKADVFVEGSEEPLDEKLSLASQKVGPKQRLCIHRCKKIHVTAHFADETKQHPFAPSATVAEVKTWFVDKIKMSPADATEHVLQITGTTDRPGPDTMIGSLKTVDCAIEFSLVPIKRVEG